MSDEDLENISIIIHNPITVGSEEEGYALLRSIQILVNEFGTDTIIQITKILEKKPQLIQKAKTYLPYINML